MRALGIVLAISFLVGGCATHELANTTLAQGNTVSDIEYKMVLDNLAMFRVYRHQTVIRDETLSPLPWHLKLTQGTTQVNDSLNPSFSVTWPPTARTAGVSGTREWAVQWTVVPETDQKHLDDLRKTYMAFSRTGKFSGDFEEGPSPGGEPFGHYRGWYVWPKAGHLGALGNLTLQVLQSAPVQAGERANAAAGLIFSPSRR